MYVFCFVRFFFFKKKYVFNLTAVVIGVRVCHRTSGPFRKWMVVLNYNITVRIKFAEFNRVRRFHDELSSPTARDSRIILIKRSAFYYECENVDSARVSYHRINHNG